MAGNLPKAPEMVSVSPRGLNEGLLLIALQLKPMPKYGYDFFWDSGVDKGKTLE